MFGERRRFLRFDVPLRVEVKKSEEVFIVGQTRNFSRDGFSLVVDEPDFMPQNFLEARMELPPQRGFIDVYGEIIWKRQKDNKWEIGVKIKEIDKASKSEILDYAYDKWKNRMREELVNI
ncbi:MAG: PilZ domain-containing protein [Candidatus Omnitrophica bacterium]|nr:PilZ domain-containing protein [Candidatus Omnitrophota bacterium]MCM8826844.1 PilZ domain-containing protein [Candidatus Omnitrophota bacterium]